MGLPVAGKAKSPEPRDGRGEPPPMTGDDGTEIMSGVDLMDGEAWLAGGVLGISVSEDL